MLDDRAKADSCAPVEFGIVRPDLDTGVVAKEPDGAPLVHPVDGAEGHQAGSHDFDSHSDGTR